MDTLMYQFDIKSGVIPNRELFAVHWHLNTANPHVLECHVSRYGKISLTPMVMFARCHVSMG